MRVSVHLPTLLAYNALIVAAVYIIGRIRGDRSRLKKIAWAQERTPEEVMADYHWRKGEEEVLG